MEGRAERGEQRPTVASHELPWLIPKQIHPTSTRLRPARATPPRSPLSHRRNQHGSNKTRFPRRLPILGSASEHPGRYRRGGMRTSGEWAELGEKANL